MRWVSDERLLVRSLELMFSQTVSALISSAIAGLILIYTFWPLANVNFLILWGLSFSAVGGYRIYLKAAFSCAEPNNKNCTSWYIKLGASICVTGVLWGIFLIYLSSFAVGVSAAILIGNFAFLLAGSVTAYAISLPIFLLFSAPVVAPALVDLLLSMDQGRWMLAAVCAGWYLFMVSTARRFGDFAIRSLGFEYENKELVEELEEQNRRAEVLAQELMVLSNTDSLTGLYNRRYFDECIEAEMSRVHRTNGALSLLLCDVDFFKIYNDTLGHVEGDRCLKKVSDILLASAREGTDVVARYGGEEFAIVLANTELAQARVFADRLRKSVENHAISHPNSSVSKHLTISIGLTTLLDIESETASHLVERADRALYRAKECGRNQVQVETTN